MAGAHDVAAMLISEQTAAGRTIDKMQLQKLLYLVQGANLEFWGEPAFRDPFQAYARGPVVPNVEQTYRSAVEGAAPIPAAVGGPVAQLDDDVIETVRTVLRYFGGWTGPDLEGYVKQPGSPWRQARGNVPDGEPSRAEIPVRLIAEWFREHGVIPSSDESTPWAATLAERAAADERLVEAKAQGAFSSDLTDDIAHRARRSLAELRSRHASL